MQNNNVRSGVGFVSLLGLLFIGLKLGNVIAWSWWWVLSPFWLPTAAALAIILVVFLVVTIMKNL